jgi:hypothetical protein
LCVSNVAFPLSPSLVVVCSRYFATLFPARFSALEAYHREHNKAPPRKAVVALPTSDPPRMVNLGKWCDTQRWHRKTKKLTEEREAKLVVRACVRVCVRARRLVRLLVRSLFVLLVGSSMLLLRMS